jgi:glycosyltransferase involved in cell wall biosynthesis
MFLGAYDLVYAYGPSRIVACEADILWTHARENMPAITALGVSPKRINVVHRGVDLEVFRPAAKVRHRIVCAARLCHDKHVDDVLHAFAKVRASWPDASLTILGDGPERSRLQNLSERLRLGAAVQFRGHVPHHVVRDEMAVAECFVLMSREDTERLTNAIKEAMACECVVIVTDSPGIDELITDGVDGFVIEHAAVDRAATLVDWAFNDVAGADAVRQKAVERIRSGFNAARAMTTYRQRWSDLVPASSAQGRATSEPSSVWSPTSTTDMV